MNKTKKLLAGLVALGTVHCATAQAQTFVDNFGKLSGESQSIYGSAGAVILKRSRPDSGTIVGANPGGGVPGFLDARDFKFGYEPGIDTTIGYRFWGRQAIEVRFMHFDSEVLNSMVTPGGFIGAGFTGPGGTRFDSSYTTKFDNWEANWRYQLFDQLSVLAGFRAINLKDTATFILNSNVATGQYSYYNRLRGAQIGADWAVFPLTSPFQINVFGKIGRFELNTAGGISEFQGPNFIGAFGATATSHVNVGEAGISAGYRPSPNVLIRGGYQALWIRDVGLASNGASFSLLNPSLLNSVDGARGNLLFHGANFGVTISY